MASPASRPVDASPTAAGYLAADSLAAVDPFLVEALQSPRHRLTVLRMELEIQKFMQTPDVLFEFPLYSTSFLRRCAHRVAQHYGLQTTALGTTVDGVGSRVIARKTVASRVPAVHLSQVPPQKSQREYTEHVKIVTRPRAGKGIQDESSEHSKQSSMRTVEERKEDYDKARARIFSNNHGSDMEDPAMVPPSGRILSSTGEEVEFDKDMEECEGLNRGRASTIAIFRDRDKDRTDPDYDRSYRRYLKGTAVGQQCSPKPPFFHPSFMRYGHNFHQFSQMPVIQHPGRGGSGNLQGSSMNLYIAAECDPTAKSVQWTASGIPNSSTDVHVSRMNSPAGATVLPYNIVGSDEAKRHTNGIYWSGNICLQPSIAPYYHQQQSISYELSQYY